MSTRNKAELRRDARWFKVRQPHTKRARRPIGGFKPSAKSIVLELQGNLDLRAAPSSTMKELRKLDPALLQLDRPTEVIVDIKGVSGLDAGAFLILSSQINRLRKARNVAKLTGNFPADVLIRRMMLDADFLGLSKQIQGFQSTGDPCLKHERGDPANTDLRALGKSIQKFVGDVAPWLGNEQRQRAYSAVVECVENVMTHAYEGRQPATREALWEVVGFHHARSQVACIAVLDRGVGIAKTVRTHVTEFVHVFDPIRSTSEFIRVAASGKRTHSAQGLHGKGLSSMRQIAEADESVSLQILSSDAVVTWSDAGTPCSERVARLDGTLVCLYLDRPQGGSAP